MRIVLVNWARVAEGASNGGGANVYAQQLGLELVERGHEVLWLSGGLTYVPDPATGKLGPCKIRRMQDFRGIRTFEVINSPVLAPGPCQAKEPLVELSAPELEAEVARFFRLVQPDIVHFHNIEGFSAGCVRVAQEGGGQGAGAKVVYSLHNYHTICPQVYLMKLGRIACHDYQGGQDCVACMANMREPAAERAHRASFHMPRIEPPPKRPGLGERLMAVVAPPGPPKPPPLVYPGRPAEVFMDIVPDEEEKPRREAAGESQQPAAADPAELEPLSNEPRPDPSDAGPLNEFGQRRRGMVEMLSRCDRVIAVSNFVQRKFEAMGVPRSVMTTLTIGSRMAELARAEPALREPPPGFDPPRPVRAVFLGYNNYYKGLPMLADALELVEPELLRRLHLCVYAKAVEEIQWRFDRLEPRMAGLSIRSGYRYEDVPRLLYGKDVGLVPSVWWDNGPQTVMEFFACGVPVIGADVGGIPDMLHHGVNGLLHRGNDRADLARTLESVLREPEQLAALRANVRPVRTMREHVTDIEALYVECLSG